MTNDKQKDRLVELLGDYLYSEQIADYLLANGIIVPPCKVGDIIWVKDFKRCCVIEEAEITEIVQNKYGTYIRYEYPALRGRIYARSIEYIGKTVFLAKNQAQEALNNEQEKL